ncbi:MAG: preprotein translocase subunit YajC [Endomicrobium sp.]|jgi:preprotein translocase subunit YajC|nr:preprotein translocase subunit YajC [Endomicrobium sp.]
MRIIGKFVELLFSLIVMIFVLPSFVFAYSLTDSVSSLGGLVPILLIFIFFYLFLMRPQQKKVREHQKLLNSLKKSDKIITTGGIYATVNSVNGDVVEVKINESVCIKIVRQSIATILINKEEISNAKEDTPEIPKLIKK